MPVYTGVYGMAGGEIPKIGDEFYACDLLNSNSALKANRESKYSRGNGCDSLTRTGKGGNGYSDYCQQKGICGPRTEGKAACRSDFCQFKGYTLTTGWNWYGCDQIGQKSMDREYY